MDWYNCSSAHSKPLNANRKAYAAWWLWATLAGWDQDLHAPTNVIISTASDSIYIAWNIVQGASSYKVYSSDNPYTDFTEDISGLFDGESWSAPIGEVKKFYYVTAVN